MQLCCDRLFVQFWEKKKYKKGREQKKKNKTVGALLFSKTFDKFI